MAGKVIITGSVTVNATGGAAGKRGDGGNRGAYREHRTNWIATAAGTSGTGGDGHEGTNGGDDTSASRSYAKAGWARGSTPENGPEAASKDPPEAK